MSVVSFGECMIELSRTADGEARVFYGGDTLNTAIYLARLGVKTRYMTALGADAWSEEMRESWRNEGVDISLVLHHHARVAGLYAISTDADGERTFTYWREQSAARAFFECDGAEEALSRAREASVLFISGITLAIFSASERRRISVLAREVRSSGGQVAFDPNYRPKLWPSIEAYKHAIRQFAPTVSIALPSFDDEASVWGDASLQATRERWAAFGAEEIVVKNGASGVLTSAGFVEPPTAPRVLDTTGAGDSFNAAYLARRLSGFGVMHAAANGAALASRVVGYPGAIIPRGEMAA